MRLELRHAVVYVQMSKSTMEVKTQLIYQVGYSFGVNETTCFGLLGDHRQVYKC